MHDNRPNLHGDRQQPGGDHVAPVSEPRPARGAVPRSRGGSRGLRGRAWRRTLVALLALPLLLPTPAHDAHAASLDGMLRIGDYEIGGFVLAGGGLAYCLEPGALAPLSEQQTARRVSELPGYSIYVNDAWGFSGQVTTSPASGETLRQMNWVLAEHGATADPVAAVAVQIAIWELRREPGNAAWIDDKYAYFTAHGGAAHIRAGKALAAEARTSAVGPGHATPEGELRLHVDAEPDSTATQGEDAGTGAWRRGGSVDYPAGTTALHITGGRFADGTTTVTVDTGAAGSVEWAATPHEPEWRRFAEVTISADWTVAERYWPAELILHPSTRQSEQRLGAGVSPIAGHNSGALDPVATSFDTRFAPEITTEVPEEFVTDEERVFRDLVTVGVASGEWPARSEGSEVLPVIAHGTLYGPFLTPREEADDAPDDAPIAARATLDIDSGPGTYDIELAAPGAPAGYYYWVWAIHESQQSDEVRASEIFEPGASFADRFGVRSERQTVPTQLRWETRLVERQVTPDNRDLTDRVRATLVAGGWLRSDAGDRIPAHLRLTYYQVDDRPTQQAEPPEHATVLGEMLVELSEPDVWTDAPVFRVPDEVRGWVTVRACLVPADQPPEHAGHIAPWCDDFGVPDETVQVIEPLATTGAAAPPERARPVAALALGAALSGVGGLSLGLVGLRRVRTRTAPMS